MGVQVDHEVINAFIEKVRIERAKQRITWGDKNDDEHEPHMWLGIIAMQGAAYVSAYHVDPDEAMKKLVNVAAVALAAYEALVRDYQ